MADLTFPEIARAIISLILIVVVVGGIVTFTTPLGDTLKKNVERVLGIGTTAVPFTDKKEVSTATSSVDALLYSVNKIAWYDTYNSPGDSSSQKIRDMAKKFLGAEAVPLIDQRAKLSMGTDKNLALRKLVKSVVDCQRIYEDRGKVNSGCFTLDFTGFTNTIDSKEIRDDMLKYMKDPDCDSTCKKFLNDLTGASAPIFGTVSENYVFKLEKDNKISREDQVKICAQQPEWFSQWYKIYTSYRIYITDSDKFSDICKLPDGEFDYGMKVINFELPQDVGISQGIANPLKPLEFAKKYTNSYGDPEYVLYYEVFPDGEDAYWMPQAYVTDVAEIMTVQGIFLAIDLIPLGRIASKILHKIPGVEKLLESFSKKIAERAANRAAAEAGKDVTDEMLRESKPLLDGIKELLLRSGTFVKDLAISAKDRIVTRMISREVGRESMEEVEDRVIAELLTAIPQEKRALLKETIGIDYLYTFDNYAEAGLEVFTPEGKFVPGFINALKGEMRRRWELSLNQEIDQEVYNRLTDKLITELSNKAVLQGAKRSPARFLIKIADVANGKIPEKFKIFFSSSGLIATKEEKQKAIQEIFDSPNRLEGLSAFEIRKLAANNDGAVKYALEMQEINPDFAKEILGSKFPVELAESDPLKWTKSQRSKVAELLDKEFDDALKDADLGSYIIGKKIQPLIFNGNLPKTRTIVTAIVVYSNLIEESIAEKFVPVGTNAFGLRTPFLATTIYNDDFTGSYNYRNNPDRYLEFFTHYEGYTDIPKATDSTDTRPEDNIDEKYLMYKGLLPEVNRYYLALVKDKGSVFEQVDQRFHLVSPCKADLIITKTQCECYGEPKQDTTGKSGLPDLIAPIFEHQGIYETGPGMYNEYYGKDIMNFDGRNKMLYTVGSNGDLLKECYPSFNQEYLGLNPAPWSKPKYTPSCIEINPVIDEISDEYNYCYKGLQTPEMRAADAGLNYVLPIGGSLLCAEAGPPGMAICGFIGGAGGGLIYSWLNTGHQWPNHN